ncbi:MAG: hypothetical protein D3906_08555 [Candidatus Electrothrix sp. AUS1_2]|nr:hypothetical protein [Candidatus Electrothrix sp. AUS1_2]
MPREQQKNNRYAVPSVHIIDSPGGNIDAAVITGRSGIVKQAEQQARPEESCKINFIYSA